MCKVALTEGENEQGKIEACMRNIALVGYIVLSTHWPSLPMSQLCIPVAGMLACTTHTPLLVCTER